MNLSHEELRYQILEKSNQISDEKDINKISELFFQLKEICVKEKNKNDDNEKLFLEVWIITIGKIKDFWNSWATGKINPSDKNLNSLNKINNFTLEHFFKIKATGELLPQFYLEQNRLSTDKEQLKVIKEKIKEEMENRQYLPNNNYQRRDNDDDSNRRKRDKPSSPSSTNNNSHLQNQITSLKTRLIELESKPNKNSREQREIDNLKQQIINLQNQFNNPNIINSDAGRKTLRGWIIGSGLVISALLVVIIVLVRKNKNK